MTDNKEIQTYQDILKPSETLNDDKIIASHWMNVYTMSNETKRIIATEILLQPYMEEAYKKNGIEPRDVKEFIQKVSNDPNACETVILHNSLAFDNNKANSKDKDGDGVSDGNNEKIDSFEEALMRAQELTEELSKFMTEFAEQKKAERTSPEPEKKWWKKAFQKAADFTGSLIHAFAVVGGITMIAGGTYFGIKAYSDDNSKDNQFGIVPDNNASDAMQHARDKLNKDAKTNYDAFTKAAKKVQNKGLSGVYGNETERG